MDSITIKGHSEYMINVDGTQINRIKSSSGKTKKTFIKLSQQFMHGIPTGYMYASLLSRDATRSDGSVYDNSGLFRVAVHRLVAYTWIGLPPEGKPWVNHKDGNKMNNHYTNLEWTSISENIQHAHDTGLRVMPNGINHWATGKRPSLKTKTLMSRAKQGKLHPQYKGCYYIRGRKYYSATSAANDLQMVTMTILRKCKKGDDKDYVFIPDPDKVL